MPFDKGADREGLREASFILEQIGGTGKARYTKQALSFWEATGMQPLGAPGRKMPEGWGTREKASEMKGANN